MINGERLNVAREACSLTQAELSHLSGVPASTISKLEKGMYGTANDKFASPLANAMDVPASFLLGVGIPDVSDGRYRKQSKASAKLTKSVVAHAKQVAVVMADADHRYKILGTTVRPLDDNQPESPSFGLDEHAAKIRDMLGLGREGPVSNITRACERAGIAIVNLPIFEFGNDDRDSRTFSGFSTWPGMGSGTARPIIVLSSSLPGDVLRSSIAHEVGHLYAHTRNPGIDDAVAERQAWDLGSRVLIPLDELREVLGNRTVTLDKLRRLKSRYGVSVKHLITYCSHAGLIDATKTASLHKQYTSRKWNKSEPVEVVRETALLFPSVLRRLQADGVEIGMQRLEVAKIAMEGMSPNTERPAKGQVLSFTK